MKDKGAIKRLSRIFQDLDFGPIEECSSILNAQVMAEETEGSGMSVNNKNRIFKECGGKRCYTSRKEAERVKKYRLKKTTGCAGRLSSYKCPDCNMWHLTSSR